MNLIDWTAFSWDNFATLATGFLAIGGALWVGAKQVAILASQNEISQKNALDTKLIKQQELQIALLERRQECIKAMRALDLVWHQKNRFEPEDWSKLDSVLSEAQLIYPAPIASKLEKVRSASMKAHLHNHRSFQYFSRKNEVKAQEHLVKAFDSDDEVMKRMPGLLEELITCTRVNSEWIMQSSLENEPIDI